MASEPIGGSSDVLVIGGGPAGSTAAILLAEQGFRVTLFEKAHHPRFHIGESLLPSNLPLFERLGVAEQMRAIGMPKWGAEFVSMQHGRSQTFQFAESWDKALPFAYQVRRSQFDEILIRRAAQVGAEVREGCRVNAVEFLPGGAGVRAEVHDESGQVSRHEAKFLVDASGRDTFLANRFAIKKRNPRHNSAAMYAHFSGARRHAGPQAGNISIYWFDYGWLWFIPLLDGTTSVGAVVWPWYLKRRTGPVRDYFLATIEQCPPLAERLRSAELVSEVYATGNFSYAAERSHGPGYLMLGDAYAFVDPMFSSGVWLAMHSGSVGAEAVTACLRQPERAPALLSRFDHVMRVGPKEFSWFIYRITGPTLCELFMAPRNTLRMKEALLSLLAGDIFGKSPMRLSLFAFKALYYVVAALNPRRSLAALRSRAYNIRPPDSEQATSPG
jgi:flavin-dependent dehydrogenase